MSADFTDEDRISKMIKHIRKDRELLQAETHYVQPRVKQSKVCGAVLVSEGEVVEMVEQEMVVLKPETHSEESEAPVTHAKGDESDVGKKEKILVDSEGSLVDVVVDGTMQGGRADIGE